MIWDIDGYVMNKHEHIVVIVINDSFAIFEYTGATVNWILLTPWRWDQWIRNACTVSVGYGINIYVCLDNMIWIIEYIIAI